MTARLPAHLEVSALIRAVEAAGGFAAVLHKGEREAGTILVVLAERQANPRLFERMPTLDSGREWSCTKIQDTDNPEEFQEYLTRRSHRDPDLWIVELDIADGERFIRLTDMPG